MGENPFSLSGGAGAVWLKAKESPGTIPRQAAIVSGKKSVEIRVRTADPEFVWWCFNLSPRLLQLPADERFHLSQTAGSDSISICGFMKVRANQEYPSQFTGLSLYANLRAAENLRARAISRANLRPPVWQPFD